jgi:hypothetical protein
MRKKLAKKDRPQWRRPRRAFVAALKKDMSSREGLEDKAGPDIKVIRPRAKV